MRRIRGKFNPKRTAGIGAGCFIPISENLKRAMGEDESNYIDGMTESEFAQPTCRRCGDGGCPMCNESLR